MVDPSSLAASRLCFPDRLTCTWRITFAQTCSNVHRPYWPCLSLCLPLCVLGTLRQLPPRQSVLVVEGRDISRKPFISISVSPFP